MSTHFVSIDAAQYSANITTLPSTYVSSDYAAIETTFVATYAKAIVSAFESTDWAAKLTTYKKA